MIGPLRHFPWKITRRFLGSQSLFILSAIVITGYSIRYYAYHTFTRTLDLSQALGNFDEYLTWLGVFLFFSCLGFQAIVARNYFRPLGRLMQRTRELKRSGQNIDAQLGQNLSDEDVVEDEPGEWSDLERAIGRIHRDFNEQAQALAREREELSALIGSVSDAILAIDHRGEPLFFNSQFAVLFGIGGGKKATRIQDLFRVPDVLGAFQNVLSSGQAQQVNAIIQTSRDELPRHFSISVAPLQNKDEARAYGAIGSFHDVTELKQAEQIRIEFVGNASHELRTPLTSIKGYLDTLRDDFKAGRLEDADHFMEIVSRNVDRLIFLVNDLLDLSTIESGAELKKTFVNVREVTEAVLRSLEGRRAAKRIEIRTEFKTESLLGDARRVEQVLTNLIHNSIKYIPDNGRIDLIWSSGSSGETQLHVRDNGPGISIEHQSRLFERFYRVDTGRSRDQGGTGLGLAIVKHIMLKHGGNVALSSRTGEGVEFICSFPLER